MTKALNADVNAPTKNGGDRALWLWVTGGFLLLSLIWVILFTVAHQANIKSVPLATQRAKP